MFQSQFAPKIISGEKRTTIRPIPKIMPRVGDVQSNRVWAGKPYRSKQIVLNEVVLTKVWPITVFDSCIYFHVRNTDLTEQEKKPLGELAEEWIARLEGFANWHDMHRWFSDRYNLPRDFILYGWEKAVAP